MRNSLFILSSPFSLPTSLLPRLFQTHEYSWGVGEDGKPHGLFRRTLDLLPKDQNLQRCLTTNQTWELYIKLICKDHYTKWVFIIICLNHSKNINFHGKKAGRNIYSATSISFPFISPAQQIIFSQGFEVNGVCASVFVLGCMVMTGIPIPCLLTVKQTHNELKVETFSPLLSASSAPGREWTTSISTTH